jgi:hypothetical protein
MKVSEWRRLQAEANLLLGVWAIREEELRRLALVSRKRGTTARERWARRLHGGVTEKLGKDD